MDSEDSEPIISPGTFNVSAAAQNLGERTATLGVTTHIIRKHLKKAVGGSTTAAGGAAVGKLFEIFSDEPEFVGGEDSYPQPLLYIAAGASF